MASSAPIASFAYASPANDPVGLPLAVSVYADRAHLRDVMRDDAAAAGLRIGDCDDLELLLAGEARALGEVVLVDCPQIDAAGLAVLVRRRFSAHRPGRF